MIKVQTTLVAGPGFEPINWLVERCYAAERKLKQTIGRGG